MRSSSARLPSRAFSFGRQGLPPAVPDNPADYYGLLASTLDEEGKFAEVWLTRPTSDV